MAIRAGGLANYKGDPYLTETEVDAKIEAALRGSTPKPSPDSGDSEGIPVADVQTYANYELVEESWDPESRVFRYIFQGTTVRLWQRMVHSKTYEATLHESQPFPGAVNPENLDTREWRLQSCTCTKQLSVPLSKRVSETWVNEGKWVLIDEFSESD